MKKVTTGAVLLLSLLVSVNMATGATESTHRRPVFLGTFSEVGYSRESGDCGGFDAQLWMIVDSGIPPMVYGFVDAFEGPCDPVPMRIVEGTLDERTGTLKFEAVGVVRPNNLKVRFEGHLGTQWLDGRLLYANDNTGQFADEVGSALKLPRVSRLQRPHW